MRRTSFQGNIHIINFPVGTKAAELAELFDEFGLVLGAEVKTIPSNGGSLRLGIVAMAPDNAADRAIEALQGHVMGSQKLKLQRAKPQVRREPKARPAPRPSQKPVSASPDWFPTAQMAPPRKVIVEYRGRRLRSPS